MTTIKFSIAVLLCLFGGLDLRAADFNVGTSGSSHYVINGTNDPSLTLLRGRTYTFSLTASGHPFWIKTNAATGTGSAYNNGVTGNGSTTGTLTFAVPASAPNSLTYICEFHSAMTGTLFITNPPPAPAVLSKPRVPAQGQFAFDVVGTLGRAHIVETSTNAASGWSALATNSPASGAFSFTNSTGGLQRRFYRVRTQ